jgi:hypothetical protein
LATYGDVQNFIDAIKQSTVSRTKPLVDCIAHPMTVCAGPKSGPDSRIYRNPLTDTPLIGTITEGPSRPTDTANNYNVQRGHEDMLIIVEAGSTDVAFTLEVERKVEIIGQDGFLAHAKSLRMAATVEEAGKVDKRKQELAG